MEEAKYIAPCGINCGVCRGHLITKNKCPGCRQTDASKPKTRTLCSIKKCEAFIGGKAEYCFECDNFPCKNLKNLDKRYRTKYGMSVIENLEAIKKHGIRNFLKSEKLRWKCGICGGIVCLHTQKCTNCNIEAPGAAKSGH